MLSVTLYATLNKASLSLSLSLFLDTIDSDDSDNDVVVSSASVYSVCFNCKHPPKKGEDLKRCSRCQFIRFCSEQCQRKDWDFHQFARSVVAKKSDSAKA